MSNQYALLYNLAHSAVSLQCGNLHEQAMHLMMATSYSGVSKAVGQPKLKNPDRVCEESGVSLGTPPTFILKN